MTLPPFSNPTKVVNPRGSGDEKFIEVDRWNRYILPDPITGAERKWTRVTTMVKKLDDTYYLTEWEKRMVAYGMAIRPDLVLQAASYAPDTLKDGNTKKDLNGIARSAKEAAGGSTGARQGTGLHNFTDRWDHGERDFVVPPPFDKCMAAYVNLQNQYGISAEPEYIERVVVLPDLGLAGKFDRFMWIAGIPILVVGDLKTQETMDYGNNLSIAMQLAAYVNAPYIWDVQSETYITPPEVSKKMGFVMHVPAARPGEAALWGLNLEKGWEYLQLAKKVDAARKDEELSWKVDSPIVAADSTPPSEMDEREQHGLNLIGNAENIDTLMALATQIRPHYWSESLEAAAAARWEELTR